MLDKRWTGVDFSVFEPWWVTSIRSYVAIVRRIQEEPGEAGEAARYKLRIAFEGPAIRGYPSGDEAPYKIYSDMMATLNRG